MYMEKFLGRMWLNLRFKLFIVVVCADLRKLYDVGLDHVNVGPIWWRPLKFEENEDRSAPVMGLALDSFQTGLFFNAPSFRFQPLQETACLVHPCGATSAQFTSSYIPVNCDLNHAQFDSHLTNESRKKKEKRTRQYLNPVHL